MVDFVQSSTVPLPIFPKLRSNFFHHFCHLVLCILRLVLNNVNWVEPLGGVPACTKYPVACPMHSRSEGAHAFPRRKRPALAGQALPGQALAILTSPSQVLASLTKHHQAAPGKLLSTKPIRIVRIESRMSPGESNVVVRIPRKPCNCSAACRWLFHKRLDHMLVLGLNYQLTSFEIAAKGESSYARRPEIIGGPVHWRKIIAI